MAFVYVIGTQDEDVCKIGFSRDPSRRLKQLQTGQSRPLVIFYQEEVAPQHVRLVERTVHANIRHHRCQGEWFRLSPERAVLQVRFAIIDLSLND